MSEEKKIGIVGLMKYNKEFFALSPEEFAEFDRGWTEILQKWEKKVKTVHRYHAVGMGKFDFIEVWEVTDIRDWEACIEEWIRYWGKYVEHYEVYIGINEPSFEEATKDIPYYKEYAKLSK